MRKITTILIHVCFINIYIYIFYSSYTSNSVLVVKSLLCDLKISEIMVSLEYKFCYASMPREKK